VTFQGEIEFPEAARSPPQLYRVEFNASRSAIYDAEPRLHIGIGDYVVTEADRGFDVGRVLEVVARPSPRDATAAKAIVRVATGNEVEQLP
jgi:hypothetical protein